MDQKTDALDAKALAIRLDRYVAGNQWWRAIAWEKLRPKLNPAIVKILENYRELKSFGSFVVRVRARDKRKRRLLSVALTVFCCLNENNFLNKKEKYSQAETKSYENILTIIIADFPI